MKLIKFFSYWKEVIIISIGCIALFIIAEPDYENPFYPYRSRTEAQAFAEHHTLADFNDPNFFQAFFFPGYPDCNNMNEYLIWRDEHPEYQPPKNSCQQCHNNLP